MAFFPVQALASMPASQKQLFLQIKIIFWMSFLKSGISNSHDIITNFS